MMAVADLVVHGGRVATDYGVFDATIVVRDGRIAALEDDDSRGPEAEAESEALTNYFTDKLAQAGRRDPRAIAEGRPPIAEYESIQRAIVLARFANARLHIVHMSIPEGANLIQSARREGVQVTAETCPH